MCISLASGTFLFAHSIPLPFHLFLLHLPTFRDEGEGKGWVDDVGRAGNRITT